jgi:hypothetical protein
MQLNSQSQDKISFPAAKALFTKIYFTFFQKYSLSSRWYPQKRIAERIQKSRGILLTKSAWNKGVSMKREY